MIYLQYQGINTNPGRNTGIHPLFVTIHIFVAYIFIIGFILSIRRYIKKKNMNSLVIVFLMLQGFIIASVSYIVYFTDWFLIPIITMFGILVFISTLVVLNIRLEKRVEERTREIENSEEKYQNLVLNIIDIIVELNSELIIIYITPQVKDLLNYKPYEMLNKKLTEFIHPNEQIKMEAALNNLFKKKQHIFIECQLISKSGDYIDVAIRGSLVQDKNSLKLIGLIRDIKDQKKAEELLKERYQKLKEIDQFRLDLVRRTSHELKTPLISLFSSSQHLLNSYKDEMSSDILKFIKIINRGSKRLKQLIDNLLDAYNIESKGLKLKIEKINLVKSIKNCANDLIFSLEERDLYLKEDLEDDFYIEVDKARIEQVILNILSNAIKNTPPKGIIYITLKHDKNYVDIIIEDTGIGLTEEEKQRLFKRFEKIERNSTEYNIDTEGSGLGLFISKEIVELHNGKILIESEGRNMGSKFIIHLPIIDSKE